MGKAPKQNIDVEILLFLSAVLALFVSVFVGLVQCVAVSEPKATVITFSSILVFGMLNYLQ